MSKKWTKLCMNLVLNISFLQFKEQINMNRDVYATNKYSSNTNFYNSDISISFLIF